VQYISANVSYIQSPSDPTHPHNYPNPSEKLSDL